MADKKKCCEIVEYDPGRPGKYIGQRWFKPCPNKPIVETRLGWKCKRHSKPKVAEDAAHSKEGGGDAAIHNP